MNVQWRRSIALVALAARGESPASHRDRRGARLARREEGKYREYLTDKQHRGAGCIGGRMQRDFHHGLLGSVAWFVAPATAQPVPQERVAAIKQSLQESMAALRQYEWVETTIVRVKGEEKSRTQQRCYYGADGKIQKIPLTQPAEQASSGGRGRRGGRVRERIVERKTEEMTEYMQQAVQVVHSYLPPDPVLVQKSKDAGKATMQPLDAGRGRIALGDYMRPGDALTVDLNLAANRILAIGVATYIEDADDTVNLTVTFGELEGAISYQSETILEAPSQNVTVIVQNSGHRRLAQ